MDQDSVYHHISEAAMLINTAANTADRDPAAAAVYAQLAIARAVAGLAAAVTYAAEQGRDGR